MLCYWILRRPDNSPAGLVRVRNDRVTLELKAPLTGTFTLFSASDAAPIAPGSEVCLDGAEALLGTENGAVTCFAAAEHAAPLAQYRIRLSRIYTKQPEPAPPAEPDPNLSQNSTIDTDEPPEAAEDTEERSQISTIKGGEEPDSVADTARETAAFSLLLRRADAFYAAYEGTDPTKPADNMVQKEDKQGGGIDLFPDVFPGARWRYADGADVLPHYEGTWTQPNGTAVRILAVRGRAAPRPPRTLAGFTRYLRGRDGAGYWVRVMPLS